MLTYQAVTKEFSLIGFSDGGKLKQKLPDVVSLVSEKMNRTEYHD